MKKQSFLTGALILMIANAISKILGAVFKIPLTYILQEEGMAVFNIAFEVYIMFLSFIISGLPFAISKLTAESNSRKEYARTYKIVRVSTILLTVIGIIGTLLLYFFAPFFALAMKEEKAVYAIQMISPAIFFVALGTSYKSYYQGVANMIPTAVSQVVESVIKLAAGYYLAVLFIRFGVEKTAGGAIMGVTAGEIIATAILMLMYIFEKKEPHKKSDSGTKEILRDLMSVALPLLCASVVSNAISVADTTLIRSRLLDAGFRADEARFLYGAYTGYALTVFHLPVGILATLSVSILPLVAGAIAVDNMHKARIATDMGIRLTIILALPCSVIMYTMSGEILSVLFHNSTAADMLKAVAPCAVMICVTQITSAILQSSGRIMLPFFTALVGSAIKLTISYFLVANPGINIYGSAISSLAAYSVVMILNLCAIRKHLCLKQDIMAIIIKPAAAAAVMFLIIRLIYAPLSVLGDGIIYVGVVCSVSFAVYAAVLFITNAVSIREVRKILKA
ncbi:MAG: polysaccharide biosynthesis protein [Oscillospiraceae bacterium]|nr:polysaccharide biosynthesis protein [Oscillospiraceae bacterium]